MLDLILILGAGALSFSIIHKLSGEKNSSNSFDFIVSCALGYVNFNISYVLLRILGISPVIETEYGNYICIRLITLATVFIISVILGILLAFLNQRLKLKAVCEKNNKEMENIE